MSESKDLLYEELLHKAKQELEENYEEKLINGQLKKTTKNRCKYIQELYMFHREYINNIINKFVSKIPEAVEFKEDFYGDGYLLFLRALRTFNVDKIYVRNGVVGKVKFKTHLYNWIYLPLLERKRYYSHHITIPQSLVQDNKKILKVKDDWGIDSTVLSSDELEVVSLELKMPINKVSEAHNKFFPLMTLAETTETHIESIPHKKKRDPNVLLKALMKLKSIADNTDNLTEFNIAVVVGKELYKSNGRDATGLVRTRVSDDSLLAQETMTRIKKTLEEKGISEESWQVFVEEHFCG
jgi:hypothetical protein